MKSDRGLVIERAGHRVTALSRSGDLVTFKSDRDDIMVGMEVSLPVPASLFTWKRLAPAIALSLVLVLVSSFAYQQYLYAQPVVAYMTVDSAGSVELEINQAGLVKSASGLDAAGQEALASVDYKNKRADEVVAALVAVQDPEKKTDVVVAFVPVTPAPETTGKQAEKTEKAMEKLEKKVKDNASSADRNLTSLRLGPDVRESAQKLGISAGRAALWALSEKNRPQEPDPEPVEPEEEPPGQGSPQRPEQGTTPPDQQGQQGEQGSTPPGQEKKENILEAIKGALPQVDPKTLTDLDERKDAKDREKFLKDLTKEWVDRIVEELREDEKPGQGNDGKGAKSNPPGESSGGDGQDDKGSKEGGKGAAEGEGSGKGSGDKGKGTASEPDPGKPSLPTQIGAESPGDGSEKAGSSKHSAFAQVIEGILRRIPWRRK